MRIRTTYPGQEPQDMEAPPHMIQNIERFGAPPPFIEVLAVKTINAPRTVTVDLTEDKKPEGWGSFS